MSHTTLRCLPLIWTLWLPLTFSLSGSAAGNGTLTEQLRVRIENGAQQGQRTPAGNHILAEQSLRRFYLQRSFQPAWSDNGSLTTALTELLASIDAASIQGLDPADYHQAALAQLAMPPLGPGQATDLELLATDAYLLLASHYLGGRVNPEQLDPEWRADRRELDLVKHLEQALASDHVGASLTELLPQQPGYRLLTEQLVAYRQHLDWPSVPAGPKLETGSTGPRVAALRARLAADGLLAGSNAPQDTFDSTVADAVRAFQAQHGLETDGVVGSDTLAELNLSRADRARQIRVNLERWRWLPNELGRRHLRVNIADYRLEAWQDGQRQIDMKVIVGRDYRRTPVFSELMRYLVLNPRWVVPPSIAVKDKLPQFRKDPASVVAKGFEIYQGWGSDERRIDPASIDWRAVNGRSFPYRLVQRPGPQNALGQIKFMLPNKFDVYLHDTPDRQLFARNQRNFSSGCIRLQRPLDLAVWVLSETPPWNRAQIDRELASGVEQTVRLKTPIPVHIQYWTAWVDDADQLQLRRDLYGRDKALAAALDQAAP